MLSGCGCYFADAAWDYPGERNDFGHKRDFLPRIQAQKPCLPRKHRYIRCSPALRLHPGPARFFQIPGYTLHMTADAKPPISRVLISGSIIIIMDSAGCEKREMFKTTRKPHKKTISAHKIYRIGRCTASKYNGNMRRERHLHGNQRQNRYGGRIHLSGNRRYRQTDSIRKIWRRRVLFRSFDKENEFPHFHLRRTFL